MTTNNQPGGRVGQGRGENGEGKKKKTDDSCARKLIDLTFKENIQLFHEPGNDAYVRIRIGDHFETWELESAGFENWLSHLAWHKHSMTIGGTTLETARRTLRAEAVRNGPEYPVHVRTGEYNGRVYVDLGDSSWRVVEIGPDGWDFAIDPPVRFRRPDAMWALPVPQKGGTLFDLTRFFNLQDNDSYYLLAGFIVNCYLPQGEFAILRLHGPEGCGKTSLLTGLKALVDPHHADARLPAQTVEQLAIAANGCYLVSYDNLSILPDDLADAFCQLVSGAQFSKRANYTNKGESIIRMKRPVVLGGIPDLGHRGDFTSRSVVLTLGVLEKRDYRRGAKFKQEFEDARPKLLGAIFSAVASTLHELLTLPEGDYPRMADFRHKGNALSLALKWGPNTFADAHDRNMGEANEVVLEASILYQPLCKLLEDHSNSWTGTASALLEEMEKCAPENVRRLRSWPKKPHFLSSDLRRLSTTLRKVGIDFDKGKKGGDRGGRFVTLTRNLL
jgi:hypothetical protein